MRRSLNLPHPFAGVLPIPRVSGSQRRAHLAANSSHRRKGPPTTRARRRTQARGRREQVVVPRQGGDLRFRSVGKGSLSWPRPRPRWATAAGVLLTPERELTERGREVKERWEALIAEAKGEQ
jgi:hypothetical protein